MNKMIKSLVALSIASACSISAIHAATYEVVDNGGVDTHEYTYAHSSNDNGQSVSSAAQVYNFPVQFQYLEQDDFDAIETFALRQQFNHLDLDELEDKAALEAGTPTAHDLRWVVLYLQSISNSLSQKVGDLVTLSDDGIDNKELVIFDKPFEGTTSLTRSTVDNVAGINSDGWIFGSGSAPYLPVPFTESDGDEVTHWVRDFVNRAYFTIDGGTTITELIAPESTYVGGTSGILGVNHRTAVGYASTRINSNLEENTILDTTGGCSDPDVLDDLPFEVCVHNQSANLYDLTAYQWDINDAGQVIAEKDLGILITPHVDDTRSFQSYAQAVNTQGVAVGFSHGWIDETVVEPDVNERVSFYAVVYKDGEVISFTPDHGTHFDSRAYDINDNGIAVGHVNTFVNGAQRTKFYWVDTNQPATEMEFELPNDFFEGSSSTARAINNNDILVGEGEVETHNDNRGNSPRRKHAFMYDIKEDTFTNLNDLLACNSGYTIIQARDINELNEISATAIVKVPKRDAKGDIELDEDGNQLVEDVVRAVTLKPISGSIEDCSVEEGEKIERKGASLSWGLLALLLSFGFRRQK